MSMKKFTKKMLAIVAAAAMTMGLAMPAFASEKHLRRQQKLTSAKPIIQRWEKHLALALPLHRIRLQRV